MCPEELTYNSTIDVRFSKKGPGNYITN